MKLTAKLPSVLVSALLICSVILLTGCGDNQAVPDGSTITISPASVTLKGIPGDTVANYKVVVRYSDGTPIPYATIYISGAFAEPALAAAYQFYWYPGGGQVVNFPVNSNFAAQANKYGIYDFSAEVYGPGTSFDDTIYVSSGTAVGTTILSVTATP